MSRRGRGTTLAALLLLVPLVACSADDEPGTKPDPSASGSPSEEVTPAPIPTPTEQVETLPPVTDETSLPQLMREEFRGSRIRFTALEGETASYTRHRVLYRSGDVRVSGVLLRPKGRGPFPGIVLNHGYIDPAIYAPGQGLAREQTGWRTPASSSCTPTTAATPTPTRPRRCSARAGSATPATRSTPSRR
ncbi:hypothetical protein [Nocardioides sp. W7]|uniref:hypothetical protein n=1 Tax=Nocardioides sp. W7 TaxID=2931390 RepID=UPI001FD1B569|nr:hypothetical protein [Nocardioides sp. W7]